MGTFLRLQTYGRVGIWLVEPYEKVGKFVILIWKRPKKDLQMPFIAAKKSTVGFEVYPYLKESKKVFVLFYPLLHPHHLTLINFAEFAERQEMWHSSVHSFRKESMCVYYVPKEMWSEETTIWQLRNLTFLNRRQTFFLLKCPSQPFFNFLDLPLLLFEYCKGMTTS